MTAFLWSIGAYFILQAAAVAAAVGRHRDPVTPGAAGLLVLINVGVAMVAMLYAAGRMS